MADKNGVYHLTTKLVLKADRSPTDEYYLTDEDCTTAEYTAMYPIVSGDKDNDYLFASDIMKQSPIYTRDLLKHLEYMLCKKIKPIMVGGKKAFKCSDLDQYHEEAKRNDHSNSYSGDGSQTYHAVTRMFSVKRKMYC